MKKVRKILDLYSRLSVEVKMKTGHIGSKWALKIFVIIYLLRIPQPAELPLMT